MATQGGEGQGGGDDAAAYPSRTARTASVADLVRLVGKRVTVAGRVLAVERGAFVLSDGTGMVRVTAPELPERFSIVEVGGAVAAGAGDGVVLAATEGRELVPSLREPTAARQWERMLLDPSTRSVVAGRARIIEETRRFFARRGFLEVDTPSLVAVPGMEPYLEPLRTEVRTADGGTAAGYLVTSPEYALKKLLVAGFERVFEISRCFRNGEPPGGLHNPEFLMLEWYRAYASYREIMRDAEELVRHLARTVVGAGALRVRGVAVDLRSPWERLSVTEAFQKYAAIDLEANLEPEALRRTIRAKGYRPTDTERYEDLFFRVFLEEIEPCLGRKTPTILYDYPARLAALSKRSERDSRFAERFEVFIAGVELANAFTELNDPAEQEARLREELALRRRLGKEVFGPDRDFLDALRTGMPPAGGIALGLDRLIMLLLGRDKIEQVRLFPAAELFAFTRKKKTGIKPQHTGRTKRKRGKR